MIDSRASRAADVAAGDRRVDAGHADLGGRLGDLDRQRRLAGGHVDQHVARFRAGQRAVGPEHHLRTSAGIADDREDDVRGLGDRLGAVGPAGAAGPAAAAARRGVRLNTVVGKPAAIRWPHMLEPITPVPIQPMRVFPGTTFSMICIQSVIQG